MDTFAQGSIVHGLCLLVCLAGVMVTVWLARCTCEVEAKARTVRLLIIAGCLLSWILSNGYGLFGGRFSWSESLPRQFCNLAHILGAYARATRHPTSQARM
nr:hypothetical protein [Verrucomicrobiales bacterium]